MKKIPSAFTVPELIVVLAMMGILLALTSMNLLSAYTSTSLGTSIDTLITDIKQQQLKSMLGDTQGLSSHDAYGIYFEPDRYILFQGANHQANPLSDYTVNLGPNLQFSNIMVLNSEIVFASVSGEIANYDPVYHYLTLKDINSGETKTIQLNNLGVIINVY